MIETLSNEGVSQLFALVQRSGCIEADLLVHLGELDERKLCLAKSFFEYLSIALMSSRWRSCITLAASDTAAHGCTRSCTTLAAKRAGIA